MGCESDELCPCSRVVRFGERNGTGEETAKPPSARKAERWRDTTSIAALRNKEGEEKAN